MLSITVTTLVLQVIDTYNQVGNWWHPWTKALRPNFRAIKSSWLAMPGEEEVTTTDATDAATGVDPRSKKINLGI